MNIGGRINDRTLKYKRKKKMNHLNWSHLLKARCIIAAALIARKYHRLQTDRIESKS